MIRPRQTIRASMAVAAVAGILLSAPAGPLAQERAPKAAPAGPAVTQVAEQQVAEQERSNYYREPGAGAMIIDGLVVRPVSFVATIIGGAVYVVTLPFSALGGNAGEAGEKLVVDPAQYTFTRCLGCFNEWR